MHNARLDFPSATRNAEAILQVLRETLPAPVGDILEIASGSGQHGVHFCAALENLQWWPSDIEDVHIASIDAWAAAMGLKARVHAAQIIDVCSASWQNGAALAGGPVFFNAIMAINMIHIAPWEATLGLMQGAAHRLVKGGIVVLYGPYKKHGTHTAPSNLAFDQSLRARNAAWGVRDMEAVMASAAEQGLVFRRDIAMPANNFCLIFEKP